MARAGKVFKFKENDFDNPFFSHYYEASKSTRRAGRRTMLDLDFWAQQAVCYPPILDANNALEIPFAMWRPALAQGGELFLLIFAKAGNSPIKWFSQLDKKATKPSLKNRMLTDYLIYLGIIFVARWSKPEHMVLNDAAKIAQWIAGTLKERQTCCIIATPSNASRICKAAQEKGLHFRGAKFLVEGEPLTQRKLKEIESAGATALSLYWFTEGGLVGGSCPNTIAEGGVHVAKDCIAVVQHQRDVEHAGVPVNAFLFSSLLPAAPRILLNVESEDYGLIEQRHCGCKLAELGYTEHIYNIRSFGWFRAEGQRVFVTDLVKLMEEVLPAEFGGSPTDYQFLEEEDERGFTRVSLAASPTVGSIDENALIATVLRELGKGLGYEKKETYREAAEVWSQANTLQVKRMMPGTTAEEQVLPLHIKKQQRDNL